MRSTRSEARLGAPMEAGDDAARFFERFGNPYIPRQSLAIRRGLEAALGYVNAEYPSGEGYDRALLRAYADAPEAVRRRTAA